MDSFRIDQVKEVMKQVTSLKEREKEISILKDEHFNIFKILRLSNLEVGLHSRFIFEMLNPNGAHHKGDVFLKLFLQLLKNNLNIEEFGSLDSLKVVEAKNEKYLGLVDYNLEVGGSLDIYLETTEFIIGIENKIHAGIGYRQLERYRNSLSSLKKSFFLLYLTLYENSGLSIGLEKNKDYYTISYSQFIIPWLELCHQHSSNNPSIRETIKQYINTVKELTGQLTNHKMNEELENLLLENYQTALTVVQAFGNVKILRIRKVYEELEIKLNKSLMGSDYSLVKIDQKALDKDYNSFTIKNKNWIDGLDVYFEGNKKLLEGFTHGLMLRNYRKDTFTNIMNNKMNTEEVWEPNEGYLWINKEYGKYKNLSLILESNDSIYVIAEELKNYILNIVYTLTPDAKKITDEFLK